MLDFGKIEDAIKEFVGEIRNDMQDKLNAIADIRASMVEENDVLGKLGNQLNKAGSVIDNIVSQNDEIIELVKTNDLNEIGDFFDKDDEEEIENENDNED